MTAPVQVDIFLEPHAEGLPLPAYETEHAAGMDLRAAISESVMLAPRERRLLPTGIRIALPPGTEAQVRPRSGLARPRSGSDRETPSTANSKPATS